MTTVGHTHTLETRSKMSANIKQALAKKRAEKEMKPVIGPRYINGGLGLSYLDRGSTPRTLHFSAIDVQRRCIGRGKPTFSSVWQALLRRRLAGT